MQLIPVDLTQHLKLCLQFREDAHRVSYGETSSFNASEITKWFEHLVEKNPTGFLHLMHKDQIIGQLEFKCGFEDNDGQLAGYINLLYLLPEYRGQGWGQKVHDHIIALFTANNYQYAYLRCLPQNSIAAAFYQKNQWLPLGEPVQQVQLMRKTIINDN